MTRRLIIATIVILLVAVTAAVPRADATPPPYPKLPSSITLQVPGFAWGYGGATLVPVRVSYGHGQIYPQPLGYGFRFQWRNLTTGAAGTVYDHPLRRRTVRTGAGQVVVTGGYYPRPRIYVTVPSTGTFYVNP
ncbi:MAG: hypothetical protein WBA05_01260 [Gordonia sp. (in: high G+C Gram-positive bacteria)]|uniref:hypothetical protein n=1 Tax=Gordonia TaxID=2053 RepID=UPI003266C272